VSEPSEVPSSAPQNSGTDVKLFLAFGLLMLVAFVGAMVFVLTRPEPAPPADDLYTSLRLSDFELIERSGRVVSSDELRGKILVVGFVFTSCGIECKISGRTMAKVQERVGERDDVQLVSLTVDPQTDTTEVLSKFAGELGADPEDWLFLTGRKDAVYELLGRSFLAEDEQNGLIPATLPAGRLPLVSRIYVVDRTGAVQSSFNAKSPDTPRRIAALIDEIAARQPAADFVSTNAVEKVYTTRGVIRRIAPDRRTAIIRHEEIPGYMPKMTMQLNLRDTNELRNLKAGDEITFKLVATEDTHWIRDLVRVDKTIEVSADDLKVFESRPGALPEPADQVFPDFEFLSEHGKPVKLSDYEGRALAFTFIFTRCPLPDYCPRMGQRFYEARKILRASPSGPTNWSFLSISFDPDYDTPEVLAGYARYSRRGDPDRWLFAVASKETLQRIAPLCDLQLMAEGGSITHNLRTLVLTPKRTIHRVLPGNNWSAADLANALSDAARVNLKTAVGVVAKRRFGL